MLNKKIKALLFADITRFFGEGMLGPLFAVFAQKVWGDVLNITRARATYLIVTWVLIVIIWKISDKIINKRKLVFAGYILNAILTFAYLLVSSPAQLLILQAWLGVAAALATPTRDALYSKYSNKKWSWFIRGLADGGTEIFTGLAVIIGWLIIVYASFSTLFIIMGIVQIISVFLLYPILKNK